MFSTNTLIFILEWLFKKFNEVSKRHQKQADAVGEQMKKLAVDRLNAQTEAQRAERFANKIASFLE